MAEHRRRLPDGLQWGDVRGVHTKREAMQRPATADMSRGRRVEEHGDDLSFRL
jgi:hypothetical protein